MNRDRIARLINFDSEDVSTGFASVSGTEYKSECYRIMNSLEEFLETEYPGSFRNVTWKVYPYPKRNLPAYVMTFTDSYIVSGGYSGKFEMTFEVKYTDNPESLIKAIKSLGEGKYGNIDIIEKRGLKYIGNDVPANEQNYIHNEMFHICHILTDFWYGFLKEDKRDGQ